MVKLGRGCGKPWILSESCSEKREAVLQGPPAAVDQFFSSGEMQAQIRGQCSARSIRSLNVPCIPNVPPRDLPTEHQSQLVLLTPSQRARYNVRRVGITHRSPS